MILFVTQNINSGFGNSLVGSLIRATIDLGYTTEYISYTPQRTLVTRFLLSIQKYSLLPDIAAYNQKVIRTCEKYQPSLVFVSKGVYLYPSTIKAIKEVVNKTIIVCFHPDDPGSNNPITSNSLIINSIPEYDYYFIWGKKFFPKLTSLGAQQIYYLPFGYDKNLIPPWEPCTKNRYEISFIGNGDRERRKWLKSFSNQNLKAPISVFGTHYKAYNNVKLYPPVYDATYFEIFRNSKININILRSQNKGALNMRTFDIPASGGFMLHEMSEEAAQIFRPNVEAVYFSSPEELADKCNYYLKHDGVREKITYQGYLKAKQEHSYHNRMQEVIKLVNL